jgi:2-dehydropantoate 2-reductase
MQSGGALKCAVVGPGALGCLLAASLCAVSDQPVWLVDHNQERAQFVRQQGLVLEKGGRTERFAVRSTADPAQVGPVDLVLLCVKSSAVASTLRHILPMLGDNSLLVAFQNGISHLEELEKFNFPGAWAVAVTAMGATLLDTGHIRFGGEGLTRLGCVGRSCDKSHPGLLTAARLLGQAGMQVQVEQDILSHVWNKLLVNVGINALTALYQCTNGALLENTVALDRMRAAVEEAALVARAKGIAISDDPVGLTMEVCRMTSSNISSMLQDVRKGRATEISAINGAIVAAATGLGILAPANERLLAEIKALEKSYLP